MTAIVTIIAASNDSDIFFSIQSVIILAAAESGYEILLYLPGDRLVVAELDLVGAGPIAGLYGAIFVGFFAALIGGTPAQVSGPTGPMTVVMAAIFVQYTGMYPDDPIQGAALAFTVVMLGGLFQINRTELDGELDSSSWAIPQPHLVEISMTEMQIALGATYLYSGRLSIYGGPFAHYISGDFDYKLNRITEDYFDNRKYSWEINEGPTYGGYIGAQFKFAKNCSANIEYQHTSNAKVFGANFMMRY